MQNLDDDDAMKDKAKEQSALDAGQTHQGTTADGHETLSLPAADHEAFSSDHAPSKRVTPDSNLVVPPPSPNVATAPGALPAELPPPMSQPADSNFAPIAPSTGPDPFAPPPGGSP